LSLVLEALWTAQDILLPFFFLIFLSFLCAKYGGGELSGGGWWRGENYGGGEE
jgi:hypothetical protein